MLRIRARLAAGLGLMVLAVTQLAAVPSALGANPQTFIVLYKQEAAPADAKASVQRAGGTLVAAYSQIGAVTARSPTPASRETLPLDSRVGGAAPTTGFAPRLWGEEAGADAPPAGEVGDSPATDT